MRPVLSLLSSKLFEENLSQKSLTVAQITEIIHTATLLHDDVIDEADSRRSHPSVNHNWSNKAAIITGDYLLSRASKMMTSLKSFDLINVYADVLENLCAGEIDQTKGLYNPSITLETYLKKSELKTAALFAAACMTGAIAANASPSEVQVLKRFATLFGTGFQVMDDVINFSSAEVTGKPSCQDLKMGIITAPVIFALQESEELGLLIESKFTVAAAFDRAVEIIRKSAGIEKAKDLARKTVYNSIEVLAVFPESDAKEALIELSNSSLSRKM